MFFTRRKNYSIMQGRSVESKEDHYASRFRNSPTGSPLDTSARSSDEFHYLSPTSSSSSTIVAEPQPRYPPKYRRIFGTWTIRTPNSSRFARHFHSRILVKFPFLVEMFYWAISFFFYRLTAIMIQVQYGGVKSLWEVAQGHAVTILEFEAWLLGNNYVTGKERWLEYRIQNWFLAAADNGEQFRGTWLTILDRGYSLIHIPGTVGFIAFYYWYCPSFNRFATARRTMTLLNLFAFMIFLSYPTMPPRFLPGEFGFVDTVNAEDAQSIWMSGKFVIKLAAMPSMHFGYAFCIGSVFVYESGYLQQFLSRRKMHMLLDSEEFDDGTYMEQSNAPVYDGEASDDYFTDSVPAQSLPPQRLSTFARCMFLFTGIFYPLWILLTIIATANHYFLDALVATLVVLMAFLCNRALLTFYPLEDYLLWAWRLEKPQPTTGWRRRKLTSRV
ncbi:hypothetical protein SPI_06911 [Niveomyces insectorum RCEF 264]|uniref:Inositolphosphotransferase Aur1/Ipt1 domain-containing protein n=1 Tax=Niveomyces insectorum RCEF 264 TaxID=1081102 RepID=A0A167QW87_9HYPO|nr:hypothetical protein SPI_06911 [Niveomyces insectorum RCEF 264]